MPSHRSKIQFFRSESNWVVNNNQTRGSIETPSPIPLVCHDQKGKHWVDGGFSSPLLFVMITCYDKSHKYRKAYNLACSFTISMKNKWMDNSLKSTSLIIAWKLSWLMMDAYVHTYVVDIRVHVNDLYSMLSRQEDLMKWIT